MRTAIEGGWVVAWSGRGHEVHEQGSVVFEGDRVVHAGGPYAGPVDARIAARGKLVSSGYINTHVHTAGNGGDYLLLDMAKNDYRTANYMAFAAPLKGKMTPPSPEATAAIRAFVFLHALKNGTTTVIDVGGLRGDWDGYARLVDELGVRVYGGPPFRDRDTYMDTQGRLTYEEDVAVGRARLQEAVDFARKFDGAAQGRLRALFNAAQVETCTESLLRRARTRRARSARRSTLTRAATSSSSSESWTSTARPRFAFSPTSTFSTSAPCSATWSSPPRTSGRTTRSATTCGCSPSAAAPSATVLTSTPRWR